MKNIQIKVQKENSLLNRKELNIAIENDSSTPKRDEIAGKIAAMLNADKNLVVVDSIRQKFGEKKCSAFVKIYETAEDLKKTEPKPKEKREKAAAPPVAAGQAAQTKAVASAGDVKK